MILRKFGTHDGSFHADEVSACALLLVFDLIDEDEIVRTRDEEILKECEYVCDVGGIYDASIKRFDHHQLEYQGSMASAGMVWLYLKDQKVIDEECYEYLNEAIILGIDAHDNGKGKEQKGVCTFSHVIANFVPIHYGASHKEKNKAFFDALHFALDYFRRILKRYQYIRMCRSKVADLMKKESRVLVFDEPMPWQENFFALGGESHPALFVVMPSESCWKLRGIPPNREHKMKVRMPLPESWAGMRDEELEKITGIEGAVFCHKGRFISVWKSREAALEAAELVLGKTKA